MFWLWVIIVALLLLRRNFRGVAKSGSRASDRRRYEDTHILTAARQMSDNDSRPAGTRPDAGGPSCARRPTVRHGHGLPGEHDQADPLQGSEVSL